MRHYKQGQNISVTWKGMGGVKTSKGTLTEISADSLKISMLGKQFSFAKQDIESISTKRSSSGKKIFGIFLIIAGILCTGFVIVVQAIINASRLDSQLRAGEKQTIWPLSILGLGIIAFGIHTLKSPQRMKDPFGQNWQVKEIPEKINNTP